MKEYGMYQGYNVEGTGGDMNMAAGQEMDYNSQSAGSAINGCVYPEVSECPKERQIHRTICHTVPHICPVHTRIINHHVYKHIYRPCYTCSEENVVINENPGCPNVF